ncbi:dihydrofolate reductase [Algoriphagus sediminis]|uniref:Dihydrofolate reductase n=1 Tax=Algoriphagus sediminis TaxID=3057113 RepID=A0ABT7YAH3_9BACT|nr:dihydrofolate reductase [Algoriphagus sediminis]MDN3203526.1 dihydrofolate reductase [Algoriphagus sediminis]
MKISLIAAVAKNGVIGKNNELLWRLPDDFKRFKKLTEGHHILMGRKTFESLGRILPNRTHLVVTRNKDFKMPEGHHVFHSIQDAFIFALKQDLKKLYVIGGGEIYKESIDVADQLELTLVDAEPDGDAFFPEWNEESWEETFREFHPADDRHDHSFTFLDLKRINHD